jgi:hypothetical protein
MSNNEHEASEKFPLIYSRIALVMSDLRAIDKMQRNEQQKFMFRGIDDVLNGVQPAMVKHQVFVTQTIVERIRKDGETVNVYQGKENVKKWVHCVNHYCFRFTTIDGSFIETFVDGEGIDYGDKASNKCNSIALKYALINTFLIPTKELDDPDSETIEIQTVNTIQQQSQNQNQHRQTPMNNQAARQNQEQNTNHQPDSLLRAERVVAMFANDFNVSRSQIEEFLGGKISSCDENDFVRLREAYGRLRAGESVNLVMCVHEVGPF